MDDAAEPATTKKEVCYCGTPVTDDPLGLCRTCRGTVDEGVLALRAASDNILGLLVISVLEAGMWHIEDMKKKKGKHARCVACLPTVLIDAAVDIYEFVLEMKRETVPSDEKIN